MAVQHTHIKALGEIDQVIVSLWEALLYSSN